MADSSYCHVAVAGSERMDGFPGEKNVHPLCHSHGMQYSLVALEDFFFFPVAHSCCFAHVDFM